MEPDPGDAGVEEHLEGVGAVIPLDGTRPLVRQEHFDLHGDEVFHRRVVDVCHRVVLCPPLPGLHAADVLEPRRRRVRRPLVKKLQLTRVRLGVAEGRVVELLIVGERADVTAEEHRVELEVQVRLPMAAKVKSPPLVHSPAMGSIPPLAVLPRPAD